MIIDYEVYPTFDGGCVAYPVDAQGNVLEPDLYDLEDERNNPHYWEGDFAFLEN